MELRPHLDPSRNEPLYRQLRTYISDAIASGGLRGGERLPATRELAGVLGVNRTTVSAAYELLEAEGLIQGQVGRGSFVALRDTAKAPNWDLLLGGNPEPARLIASAPISFAASRPPEDRFPVGDFRLSAQEVLANNRLPEILQLGSAAGYEPLRSYLLDSARDEGLLGADDDLLVTNGCQQALDLLARVMVRSKTRVAIEDPVYPGLKNILRGAGANLIPVPLNGERFDWESGASSGYDLAVITPNFQNPTGLSLSVPEREAIVRHARQTGAVLVENDIYSALRYHGDAAPSLKRMSPDAPILLMRSFSKVAFPGLRIGWVIGPRRLVAAMRELKQLSDFHTDQFSQAVMLRFSESGRLQAHIGTMIRAGRERLAAASECLERFFPVGTRWTQAEGGLNLWVTLPGRLETAVLLDRARREGVAYLPGALFGVRQSWTQSLRLSFGGVPVDRIKQGLEILGRVFGEEHTAWRLAASETGMALV